MSEKEKCACKEPKKAPHEPDRDRPGAPWNRHPMAPGYYSNQEIIRRNGGIRPQFVDDIGGCSANYR